MNNKSQYIRDALLIAAIAAGTLLTGIANRPVSDDFSWFLSTRQLAAMPWAQFLLQPAPFGYFRPVPMAIFRLGNLLVSHNTAVYHAAIIVLHTANCLLAYALIRQLRFGRQAALVSALIFAVLPCHAESLLWICCLNDVVASSLLLLGFLFFLRSRTAWEAVLPAGLFTAALLCRESAFCFIPLLALFLTRAPGPGRMRTAVVMSVPLCAYGIARFSWMAHQPIGNIQPSPGPLDLNPLHITGRIGLDIVKMLLPVKTLLELTGFGLYQTLRQAYSSPAEHPLLFLLLLGGGAIAAAAIVVLAFRSAGRRMLFPLALMLLGSIVYLPFHDTAERFLYFPSLGAALGMALVLTTPRGGQPRLLPVLAAVLVTVYAGCFAVRTVRWAEAGRATARQLGYLHQHTAGVAHVAIEGAPTMLYGVPFISRYTFGDAWSYTYPARPLSFAFDTTAAPMGTATFRFNQQHIMLEAAP
jgi:hypothetical protein